MPGIEQCSMSPRLGLSLFACSFLFAKRPTSFPVSPRLSHCGRGWAEDYEGLAAPISAGHRGLPKVIKVIILGVING
jgi:hypothetical protein